MSHNHQKKIALINDLSGFGRCSIAVELPIISMLKVQCCPVPTSIFTNHTGFESFYYSDYTKHMPHFIDEWKKLDLRFDGICSGFLGSERQIDFVRDFIGAFKTERTQVIIDPVMGDYGKLYPTYSPKTSKRMKQLVELSDIITPNLTEACILTERTYHDKWHIRDLTTLAEELSDMGPQKIVITGIIQGGYIANFCFEKGCEPHIIRCEKTGTQRSGTGDIFCSIIAADAVNNVPFQDSVKKATRFVKKCIAKSIALDIPVTDGVCFEEVLYSLK